MKRARAPLMLALVAFATLHALACRSKSSEATTLSSPASAPPAPSPLVAARPFRLDVPASYDPKNPAPLLVALHGYGADGDDVASEHWGVSAVANARGAFVAHPDGTADPSRRRFWNATDACCDFEHTKIEWDPLESTCRHASLSIL